MRHNIALKKMQRPTAHRSALLKNLAISLIEHEQIVTTLPKAKSLRPYVEKLVTIAKNKGLHARRQLVSTLQHQETVEKLIATLGARYAKRPGGYTRIMKAGFRTGDSAAMAVIEFVDRDVQAKGKRDYEILQARKAAEEAAQA